MEWEGNMPVNQIKSPEDEKIWQAAKDAVSKQGVKPTDPKYWKLVSTIFNKMKGGAKK
jgi:hypothetical protein